jgi:serine/threonine protein kinase
MALNSKIYRGKSVRLDRLVKEYPYHILDGSKTEIIKLNFDCRLEMASDGKSIKVSLTPPDTYSLLGKGTFKIAHKGRSFTISLRQPGKERISYQPMVRYRINEYSDPTITKVLKEKVVKGFEMQKKVKEKLGEQAKIVSVPQRPLPNVNPSQREPDEWMREWYRTDLLQAQKLPLLSRLSALRDVAHTVRSMHENGFVYRDLNRKNILLRIDKCKNAEGFLSDFDLASFLIKGGKEREDYPYWNISSKKGWITPLTDVYPLALILAEVCIPEFLEIRDNLSILKDASKRDHKLLQIIKEYVKSYANYYQLDLSCLQIYGTPVEVCSAISRMIDSKSTSLTDKQKLTCLNRRLQSIESVFLFVASIVCLDEKVYQYLKRNIEIERVFKLGNQEADLKKKMKAFQEIEAQFPAFTISAFLDQLSKVENILIGKLDLHKRLLYNLPLSQ